MFKNAFSKQSELNELPFIIIILSIVILCPTYYLVHAFDSPDVKNTSFRLGPTQSGIQAEIPQHTMTHKVPE